MRPILLLFFLTSLFSFSHAQEKDSVKVAAKYFIQINSGIGLGDNLATVSFHQGMVMNRVRLGIGIAYEGKPEWRIFPLYGVMSLDIIKVRANAFYIQAHYGGSFAKYKPSVPWGILHFKDWGGKAYSCLLGYRIMASKYSLYFSGGYSEQNMGYSYDQFWGQSSTYYKMETRLRNIILQLGIGLH